MGELWAMLRDYRAGARRRGDAMPDLFTYLEHRCFEGSVPADSDDGDVKMREL